jgi:dihydroxyacetone kinase
LLAQLRAILPCVQLTVERLYVGPLMTALDMNGFSLTLMEVDDARLEMLDAPTEVGLGSGLGAVIP